MLKDLILRWIAALESGKYKKGCTFLRDNNDNYCCLGVLCELEGLECVQGSGPYYCYDGEATVLPYVLRIKYGLDIFGGKFQMRNLVCVNDCSDTFEPVIEHIKVLYKEVLAQ